MLALHIEINIFCILLLGIIFFDIHRSEQTKDQKLFLLFILDSIIFCAADIVSTIFDGRTGSSAHVLMYIMNMLYFISSALVTYLWLLFVLEKLRIHKGRKNRWRYIWSIPLILFVILILFSPLFPLVFEINEQNVYTRGRFIWIHWVVAWGYVLFPTIYVILHVIKEKEKNKRKIIVPLFLFALFPFVGSIFQVIFPMLSVIQVGFTISAVFIYIKLQDTHVSTDTLTGLTNRSYFEKYLDGKIKSLDHKKSMFLMMMDIDDFRQMNDLLGHSAGDDALIRLATILADEAKERSRMLPARYDSDEFAIFGYDYEIKEIEDFIASVRRKIELQNMSNGSYSIDVSIGYIRATKFSFMNTDQLLDLAEAEVEKNKKQKDNHHTMMD